MKRLLACLLILLLPFQSAWAVAGAFCGDAGMATTPAADVSMQSAHHEHHAHDAVSTDATDSDLAACASMDGHCAACHIGCCTAAAPLLHLASNDADVPMAQTRSHLPSPASQRPERPKWHALA